MRKRRSILFAEFVAGMEDTRLPECVMFGELVGGAGCVEGQEKDRMSSGRPQSFRYQRRPVDNCSPAGRGGMAQDAAEQGVERFMTKWITVGKFRARQRHAVSPNVTGRTKDSIAQIKHVRVGSLAIYDIVDY